MPRCRAPSIRLVRSRYLHRLLFCVILGAAVGIGVYTFIYAQGYSYLTNDPSACANCHIMTEHYDAWLKSSHQTVAVCNDCHTPSAVVPKYITKAENGFWHSVAFTTGDFPYPLRIKPSNLEVAEAACLKCHQEIVAAITPGPHQQGTGSRSLPDDEAVACVHCHDSVGHWVR